MNSRLDAALLPIGRCPLCSGNRFDTSSTATANLYSEQLAVLIDCDEKDLLQALVNRRCLTCGLWSKPLWLQPSIISAVFEARVPVHPRGWDAGSPRFSESGFAAEIAAFAHAIEHNHADEIARYRRALPSIVDSVTGLEGSALRSGLLSAIAEGDIARLRAGAEGLRGRFDQPAAFKRFSGFSADSLWDWLCVELGPIQRYAEVGCPLWGQLARAGTNPAVRVYLQRAEANYWGSGCRQSGQHCLQALAARAPVHVRAWAERCAQPLDLIGAFQYLDHLGDPLSFCREAFAAAPALLLILDGVDAPPAVQHLSGWSDQAIAWLAAATHKRVVQGFTAIEASGNRAWLLCDA